MNNISLKRWIITCITLIALGLAADFYFLHILFPQKQINLEPKPQDEQNSVPEENHAQALPENTTAPTTAETKIADSEKPAITDNFLQVLQKCRNDISAQGIATPNALMTYLEKTVGVRNQETDLINYNIILPDGSERRIHVIPSDNTNSKLKREVRLFKVDAEGYPVRIPMDSKQASNPSEEFIQSLVSQGKIKLHQTKKTMKLKDNSDLEVETRNNTVFEFQLRSENSTFACRETDCTCL